MRKILTASTPQEREPSRTPGSRFGALHPDALCWSQRGGRCALLAQATAESYRALRRRNEPRSGRKGGGGGSGERLSAIQTTNTAFSTHERDVCAWLRAAAFFSGACSTEDKDSVALMLLRKRRELPLSNYSWSAGSPDAQAAFWLIILPCDHPFYSPGISPHHSQTPLIWTEEKRRTFQSYFLPLCHWAN